jgi:hypothetical protein
MTNAHASKNILDQWILIELRALTFDRSFPVPAKAGYERSLPTAGRKGHNMNEISSPGSAAVPAPS